jgi:hypothetical protein
MDGKSGPWIVDRGSWIVVDDARARETGKERKGGREGMLIHQ